MGLLQTRNSPEFQEVTNKVFRRQLEEDSDIDRELSETAKKKMYQDVCYNMDILYTALELDDGKIYECHARWLYQLLCPLMNYCTRERIRDQMLDHYNLVKKYLVPVIDVDKQDKLVKMLDAAIEVTMEECTCAEGDRAWGPGKYENETKEYLNCLMDSDTKGAVYLISEYIKKGIPLEDVLVDIIAKTMEEVGELWHQNLVSVDMEHYCTSTTQLAMLQLYPIIFRRKRKDRTVLAALSVTMPQHLPECKAAVLQIRDA